MSLYGSNFRFFGVALTAAAVVAACGGSGSDSSSGGSSSPPPPASSGPQRGDLLGTPSQKSSMTGAGLVSVLAGGDPFAQAMANVIESPKCSVNTYVVTYESIGPKFEAIQDTAALLLPSGTDPACTGPRPVLLYAHGTSVIKSDTMTDLSTNEEATLIALVFASQGYIVVAPDYAGYGGSNLSYHPYLVADQQSKDMIDALKASRSALGKLGSIGVSDNGKLYITGYSQGGYVAMAAQRAIEASGATVTAAAPMSGPYALSAFGDAIFEGQVSGSATVNLTFILNAYQNAYGNVYSAPTDAFESTYATGIQNLLPGALTNGELTSQGRLPVSAAFSSTPPSAAYAAMTPATTPAQFAPLYAMGFGTSNLVTNSFRLAYLSDAMASPDGGFPTVTNNEPPANPQFGLRIDLKQNDLRNWAPKAPVLLCGGENDPTVYFLNTQLMQQYWSAHAPAAAVDVLNVDTGVSIGGDYSDLKTAFATVKTAVEASAVAGGATDGGFADLLQNYHSGVAPFCVTAAKRFFDSH